MSRRRIEIMEERSLACFIVFLLGIWIVFPGCATVQKYRPQSTENLLIATGFIMKVPTTPEGEAKFKALKPLEMAKGIKDGQVIYVYSDPYSCKCAYVGGEQQYAEFKRRNREQQATGQMKTLENFPPPYPVESESAWWW